MSHKFGSKSKERLKTCHSDLQKILNFRAEFIEKEDGSYVSKGDLLLSDLLKKISYKWYPDHEYISEEDYKKKWKLFLTDLNKLK